MVTEKKYHSQQFYLKDDGSFPNNERFPVLVYKNVLKLPGLFAAHKIKTLFSDNDWSNSWKNGVYDFHHYHSITHEVLGVYKGGTTLLLGGEKGIRVTLEKGDVLVIPAGVAHKNLEPDKPFKCVGAYPQGKKFDMNYGKPGERPYTDINIKNVPIPEQDPVFGFKGDLKKYWVEKPFF